MTTPEETQKGGGQGGGGLKGLRTKNGPKISFLLHNLICPEESFVRPGGGGGRAVPKRGVGGGGGSGTQKYQKWPDKIFPTARLHGFPRIPPLGQRDGYAAGFRSIS